MARVRFPDNAFCCRLTICGYCAGADVSVPSARLAQSVERQPFKLVVVGSSPTVGDFKRNLQALVKVKEEALSFSEHHWSSGYDARLTRERSPVQSWDDVNF